MITKINITLQDKEAFDWLKNMLERSHNDVNSRANKTAYYQIKAWVDALNEAEIIQEREKRQTSNKPKTRRRKKAATKEQDTSGLSCPNHPTYGGMRQPRKDCDNCWSVFGKLNGEDLAKQKRRQFKIKQKKNIKN